MGQGQWRWLGIAATCIEKVSEGRQKSRWVEGSTTPIECERVNTSIRFKGDPHPASLLFSGPNQHCSVRKLVFVKLLPAFSTKRLGAKIKAQSFIWSLSVAIVLIKQSPFIRASLTHFISLLFCFEISWATINFREREREREFNKDLLLLSASIAVMKIYFLSLLCPI